MKGAFPASRMVGQNSSLKRPEILSKTLRPPTLWNTLVLHLLDDLVIDPRGSVLIVVTI